MKTIVFDLGGVLIDWNPRNMYRKYLNDQQMDYLLTEVCTMKWNALMDAGLSFEEGAKQLIEKFPEHAAMIKKYGEEWPEMIGGAKAETVSILEELYKQNYPLYALTNWSMETFPPVLKRFDFFRYFNGIVVSAEEKVVKPEEKLYQILLERYSLDPHECIFIDDNYDNIVAAEQLGMLAFHFKDAGQLREDLQSVLPDFKAT
jgi:2-haloacid dehalogenase